ncbi:MAG: hypothetical protein RLZZ422_2414 [Pseudomonadota bacterium]|jgi:hypothetical protein
MIPQLAITLRERSPFEALDLGIRLTQTAGIIWRGWLLFLVMISLLLWALLPSAELWIGMLVVWWLKPFYDRFLLQGFSQVVAEQPLTLTQWFNSLSKVLLHSPLWAALTLKRFSPVRSYVQPIGQLEGLKGREARKRRTLLTQQFNRHAAFLSISLFVAQLALFLSCYGLLLVFDPTDATYEHIRNVFSGYIDREEEYWHHLMDYSFWVASIAITEPFYVAAGFTLYLNRRVQLEAWDIEQSLRALVQRLTHKASTVILSTLMIGIVVMSTLPSTSFANDTKSTPTETLSAERLPANQAKTQIENILTEHEQQTRTVYRWVEKNKTTETKKAPQVPDQVITSLSQFLEGSLWVFIVLGLILALIYRQALLKLLLPKTALSTAAPPPTTLFGLDITAASLPKDIPAAVKAAWQQGDYRQALSLLYRSALYQLTHEQHLHIQTHHTEGDVLVLAKPTLPTEQWEYLKRLTQYWQQTAYGHITPNNLVLEQLLPARPTEAV